MLVDDSGTCAIMPATASIARRPLFSSYGQKSRLRVSQNGDRDSDR